MDDSVITCDDIIEEIVPTNFMKRKQPGKGKISIFSLHFY